MVTCVSTDEALLLRDLQILELAQYEGKALAALIKLGVAEASKISQVSGVPQSRIYQIMRELEKREIVTTEQVKGRANFYRLLSKNPSQTIFQLQDRVSRPIEQASQRAQKSLAAIHQMLVDLSSPEQELWTIRGSKKITKLAEEMIELAQDLIICTFEPILISSLLSAFISARNQGVEIRFLMPLDKRKEIEKSISVGSIATEIGGFNLKQLKRIGETFQIGKKTLINSHAIDPFGILVRNHPKVLLVDPKTSQGISLIVMRSSDPSIYNAAIQITNPEMIDFQFKLIGLIREIMGATGSLEQMK